MNTKTPYLHDIELPATGITDLMIVLLISGVILSLLVIGIGYYYYQRQQTIPLALRQLRLLSSTTPDPHALAILLCQGLQVSRLQHSALPKDFLQRLDQVRFSSHPCTSTTFIQLKADAKHFLEQQQ